MVHLAGSLRQKALRHNHVVRGSSSFGGWYVYELSKCHEGWPSLSNKSNLMGRYGSCLIMACDGSPSSVLCVCGFILRKMHDATRYHGSWIHSGEMGTYRTTAFRMEHGKAVSRFGASKSNRTRPLCRIIDFLSHGTSLPSWRAHSLLFLVNTKMLPASLSGKGLDVLYTRHQELIMPASETTNMEEIRKLAALGIKLLSIGESGR